MKKSIFIFITLSLLCNYFSYNITSVDALVYNKNDLAPINYFLNIVFTGLPFDKNQFLNVNKLADPIDSNSANQIWWSGLGGSVIGAVIGVLGGGYISSYLSKKNISENQHLTDLKQDLVKLLILEVKDNFNLSDETDERFMPTTGISDSSSKLIDNSNIFNIIPLGKSNIFDYSQKGTEIEISSENILLEDLINNHYPKVETQLKQMLKIYIDFNNSKNNLLLVLRDEVKKVDSISIDEKKEIYYKGWKETLIDYIKNKHYDDSFLRITEYGNNVYLYIYHTKNDILPFGIGEHQYLIFKAFGASKEENMKRVQKVRVKLLSTVQEIKNAIFFQNYEHTRAQFYEERKKLLKYLYEINYSTSLNFEKTEEMRKKCSLVS